MMILTDDKYKCNICSKDHENFNIQVTNKISGTKLEVSNVICVSCFLDRYGPYQYCCICDAILDDVYRREKVCFSCSLNPFRLIKKGIFRTNNSVMKEAVAILEISLEK